MHLRSIVRMRIVAFPQLGLLVFAHTFKEKGPPWKKVKNLRWILHHPPPTPSQKNSLFLYLEEFSILVVDVGGFFHKYACAVDEWTPKKCLLDFSILMVGDGRYTFADTHAQKTCGN